MPTMRGGKARHQELVLSGKGGQGRRALVGTKMAPEHHDDLKAGKIPAEHPKLGGNLGKRRNPRASVRRNREKRIGHVEERSAGSGEESSWKCDFSLSRGTKACPNIQTEKTDSLRERTPFGKEALGKKENSEVPKLGKRRHGN